MKGYCRLNPYRRTPVRDEKARNKKRKRDAPPVERNTEARTQGKRNVSNAGSPFGLQ